MVENKKVRIIISVVLFFIIVTTAVYLYQHRDKLFTSTYELTYPDRCVEVFENDMLVTEECTIGRHQLEAQQNESITPAINMEQWNPNLNLT